MSPGVHVRALMANEVRALLPVWIACVLAATIAALTGGTIHTASLFAFLTATVGLAAQSIGHEYAHRTLDLTLTLPVDRRQVFVVKLVVLAGMVVPLAAYAWLVGLFDDMPAHPWVIAVFGLCLAPSMTMLCRNALAGTLFSMSLPAMLGMAVMTATGGAWGGAEAERLLLAAGSSPTLLVSMLAGGVVLGWWRFMRLEAIEGGVMEIHPTWPTRSPRSAEPSRPLWQLLKKELRLQQMTLGIAALYLATAWPTTVLLRLGRLSDDASFAGAAIYWLGLPVVAGALSTAEERRLGTLSWQLQLPTPAWQQWVTKVGTVFGLSVVLGTGVLVLLGQVLWPAARPSVATVAVLSIALAAVSLYISSLCSTGLRAVVASLAAIPSAFWLVVTVARVLSPTSFAPEFWRGAEGAWLVLVSVGVVLLVGFAFANHRPEPPAASRIWRQTLSLAALIGCGIAALQLARF